jgi:hypothetical protein
MEQRLEQVLVATDTRCVMMRLGDPSNSGSHPFASRFCAIHLGPKVQKAEVGPPSSQVLCRQVGMVGSQAAVHVISRESPFVTTSIQASE